MARLTSLLHYYADRAATHDLITPAKLADIHRYIDRVEEKAERAEISDSVLMSKVSIGEGAVVRRAILDKNVRVPAGATARVADPAGAGRP